MSQIRINVNQHLKWYLLGIADNYAALVEITEGKQRAARGQ